MFASFVTDALAAVGVVSLTALALAGVTIFLVYRAGAVPEMLRVLAEAMKRPALETTDRPKTEESGGRRNVPLDLS